MFKEERSRNSGMENYSKCDKNSLEELNIRLKQAEESPNLKVDQLELSSGGTQREMKKNEISETCGTSQSM